MSITCRTWVTLWAACSVRIVLLGMSALVVTQQFIYAGQMSTELLQRPRCAHLAAAHLQISLGGLIYCSTPVIRKTIPPEGFAGWVQTCMLGCEGFLLGAGLGGGLDLPGDLRQVQCHPQGDV